MKFSLDGMEGDINECFLLFPKREYKKWMETVQFEDYIGGYGKLVSTSHPEWRPEGGVSSGAGHKIETDYWYERWIVEVDTLEELIEIGDNFDGSIEILGIDEKTGFRYLRNHNGYD